MTEKPIRETLRLVGLRDTRIYSDVRHICFKFKTTLESFCKVQKFISFEVFNMFVTLFIFYYVYRPSRQCVTVREPIHTFSVQFKPIFICKRKFRRNLPFDELSPNNFKLYYSVYINRSMNANVRNDVSLKK